MDIENKKQKDASDIFKNYACEGQINMLDLYRRNGEPRTFYKKLLDERSKEKLKISV